MIVDRNYSITKHTESFPTHSVNIARNNLLVSSDESAEESRPAIILNSSQVRLELFAQKNGNRRDAVYNENSAERPAEEIWTGSLIGVLR